MTPKTGNCGWSCCSCFKSFGFPMPISQAFKKLVYINLKKKITRGKKNTLMNMVILSLFEVILGLYYHRLPKECCVTRTALQKQTNKKQQKYKQQPPPTNFITFLLLITVIRCRMVCQLLKSIGLDNFPKSLVLQSTGKPLYL